MRSAGVNGAPDIMDSEKLILQGIFGNAGNQGMVVVGELDTRCQAP